MTLKDLGLPSLEELEAMSDDEIRRFFGAVLKPVQPLCEQEKPKKTRKKKLNPEQLKLLNELTKAALAEKSADRQ